MEFINQILHGDAVTMLRSLPEQTFNSAITSPPYFGQRDYGIDGQIGVSQTLDEYIQSLVSVFREVRRVLRDDGTLWLNLGDTYATGTTAPRKQSKNPGVGSNRLEAQNSVPRVGNPEGTKTKDLIGVPWRVALALQADGWYLRMDNVWFKPNATPESVNDRPTKSHEYMFLLSKSERYYYDKESVKEPSTSKPGEFRNMRSVWTVNTKPYKGAHFATFPPELVRPCVLAGSPVNGIVLDPFFGSGTVGQVALEHGRSFCGIELNSQYIKDLAMPRIEGVETFGIYRIR